MKPLACLLVAAACAGRSHQATTPEADNVPYRVAQANEHKLSAHVIQQWREYGLARGEYTPIILTIDGELKSATVMLHGLGAAWVRPVETSPGAAGTLHARATTKPTKQVVAMLMNDSLMFVVAQDWVTHLDGANSYPSGPELDPAVAHKLDPALREAISRLGRDRPYAVGALAEMKGCMTDKHRAAIAATGAIVSSVIAHPSCSHTIFGFEVPLARLTNLAELPFIITMEGGGHYLPDREVESKNEAD